jgi:hypothetical protein
VVRALGVLAVMQQTALLRYVISYAAAISACEQLTRWAWDPIGSHITLSSVKELDASQEGRSIWARSAAGVLTRLCAIDGS